MEIKTEDSDLVAHWIEFHPKRYFLGIISGLIASGAALIVANQMSLADKDDFHYTAKLFATIFYGFSATEYSVSDHIVFSGYALLTGIGIFWSVVFSHFVISTRFQDQILVGFCWAFLSWVFTWNLFSQSFYTIQTAGVPSSAALAVCMTYGLSLSSLSVLDWLLKKRPIS
jgi:hypothetical protein